MNVSAAAAGPAANAAAVSAATVIPASPFDLLRCTEFPLWRALPRLEGATDPLPSRAPAAPSWHVHTDEGMVAARSPDGYRRLGWKAFNHLNAHGGRKPSHGGAKPM